MVEALTYLKASGLVGVEDCLVLVCKLILYLCSCKDRPVAQYVLYFSQLPRVQKLVNSVVSFVQLVFCYSFTPLYLVYKEQS